MLYIEDLLFTIEPTNISIIPPMDFLALSPWERAGKTCRGMSWEPGCEQTKHDKASTRKKKGCDRILDQQSTRLSPGSPATHAAEKLGMLFSSLPCFRVLLSGSPLEMAPGGCVFSRRNDATQDKFKLFNCSKRFQSPYTFHTHSIITSHHIICSKPAFRTKASPTHVRW